MFESHYWWPLSLDAASDAALVSFRDRMTKERVSLDLTKARAADTALVRGMRNNFEEILSDDRVSSFCHIFNGWGNLRWKGHELAEQYVQFVYQDRDDSLRLLQMHPEGDFHPWQSFGYAIMAGLSPASRLWSGGPTLRELAMASRHLSRKDGDELGHLLYSVAHLGVRVDTTFSIAGEILSLRDLIDMALHAHDHGTFRVCRKIHLTEGLCAIVAKVPGFEDDREAAEGFLEGQLDILFALGALITELDGLRARKVEVTAGGLASNLRDSLALDWFFENHAYLAGHLIELATLAHGLGYRISDAHRSAMAFIANSLNEIFPAVVHRAAWPVCFLHFGHYRRGLTLLMDLEARAWPEGEQDRAAFTVDFDALGVTDLAREVPGDLKLIYDISARNEPARARFLDAAHAFDALVSDDLKLRGAFAHFRRTSPSGWPRALHYELLDEGESIGVELHVEDEVLRPLIPRLRALEPSWRAKFPDAQVSFDAEWQNLGRLRVCFDDSTDPVRIATALRDLVVETQSWLGEAAHVARRAG